MVKGVGTVIYHVTDLARAKEWYARAFEQQPYFDQPFYVGFNIAGYELGLDPNTATVPPGRSGSVAYWRVDVSTCRRAFRCGGARLKTCSGCRRGIKVATVTDPFGNADRVVENPHFSLPAQ
jgi:hypothetical protein